MALSTQGKVQGERKEDQSYTMWTISHHIENWGSFIPLRIATLHGTLSYV